MVDYLGAPMTSNIVLFILILAFVYQQALSQGRLIKIKRMQLEIEVGIPWPRTFMSLSTNCLSRVWVHPNKFLFMYTHSCSIPWPCTLISLCPHLVCGSASALFLFCCGSLQVSQTHVSEEENVLTLYASYTVRSCFNVQVHEQLINNNWVKHMKGTKSLRVKTGDGKHGRTATSPRDGVVPSASPSRDSRFVTKRSWTNVSSV